MSKNYCGNKSENLKVLAIVALFSRNVPAKAIPYERVESIARTFMMKKISAFGRKESFLLDRGLNLVGGLSEDLKDFLKTGRMQTYALNPQPSWTVER